MDRLEQENHKIREEVNTLRDNSGKLTAMMETLVTAQNQPPPSPQTLLQTTVISEIVSTPISVAPVSAPQHRMPPGFPWGMPPNFLSEGYQLVVEVPMAQPIMSVPPPVVHTVPYVEEPIFHAGQSETVSVYERMDEFQAQFQAMHKEINALREKYLFGKNAHDLRLVLNVKIPHKFKVPDFKKYKGNSFPLSHLVMYAGAPDHDIENCFALKVEVRRNPRGYDVVKRDLQEMLEQNLIQIRRDMDEDEHEVNVIVPRFNIPEPVLIAYNGQKSIVFPLVIRLVGPKPYESDKVVPYKYNAPKRTEDAVIEKPTQEKTPVIQTNQSNIVNQSYDHDEVLKLIKKSDFNMVDQLLHTSSKISILSLLMSSDAHLDALQKVLEQAYVDHDVMIDQFDGIVANITACNNMSFNDEEKNGESMTSLKDTRHVVENGQSARWG
ncbi:uncharacterized protein LOC127103140 [Lathyrus oleraceus]|uniref:uncharacterized protein LOC127103140 n=1 Tax=Pisum sativum TaxID=3888 RepID=UPI0021D1DE83|nr:uncharacterized protein LOC127103140 [Pisum sativum]